MAQYDIDAILVEAGTALNYFSGVRWGRSERLTGLVIPKNGMVAVVTPYFEEPSIQESLGIEAEIRTWHEDQSPFARVAQILRDRGIQSGKLGLEETVRQFIFNGLRRDASAYQLVAADPVTRGCRMIKTKHEITLMKKASEVTLDAYKRLWPQVKAGMTPRDITSIMRREMIAGGGSRPWALALVGVASAYPHGSDAPQVVSEGEVVLMDCGCNVHGYQSDISRTFVYGEPDKEQRRMWQHVRNGQDIVFKAAQVGTPAGKVDEAVRTYYETLGYGPDYKTPGLSHRTGHGIGMDGHEPINFVRSETTPLAPGMCFSNEPGIYDFSRYGVRIEDCIYITEDGPRWFTMPPESLENPFGSYAP